MCDNCKDDIQSETKELTSELSETLTPPLSDSEVVLFFEPLELGTDNLAEDTNIQFDNDEFKRGLKDSSYFAGLYTGLLNCGMSMEDAFSLILNKMNVDHNILSSKISAETNIEVSKNVAVSKEKESL